MNQLTQYPNGTYSFISTEGVMFAVPNDPANADYQAIQNYLANGGSCVVIEATPPEQESAS